MGSVFSFVSSDLKQKIDILIDLKNKDTQNYTTVKSMIEYEKENKLLEKGDFVNGARTLLRLHRGLDFIRVFLLQLGDLTDLDKTGSCCQDAYNKTLAKHHPWVIRKAAIVAMYTMPTKETLFKKVKWINRIILGLQNRWYLEYVISLAFDSQVCGENVQRNIDVLPKMLEVTADVFNRTDRIYETYQLHALP